MRRMLAALALFGLVLAGCGASTSSVERTAPLDLDERGVSRDVPDVQVVDVPTGAAASLRTLIAGDKPVLLWFWAPH